MSLSFATPRPRRRPSLTPMIDVVFLLLVFFLLVARFGGDTALPIATAGAGGDWQGPPRLIDIRPEGLSLNGLPVTPQALPGALAPLVAAPDDPVILRPRDGASLQALVDAMALLEAAGHTRLIVVD